MHEARACGMRLVHEACATHGVVQCRGGAYWDAICNGGGYHLSHLT